MNNTLNLTHLPKEVLLILEILKGKDERQKGECLETLSHQVDWQLFLDYAIHHRIYPMLYRQLKQLKESLNIPPFVIQSLEELYKENTFKMLQLSAEMNEIGKLFADQEINTLFMKGPILAQHLFGDISLRTSKDLDLLIPLDQLEKAQRILEGLGYEQVEALESLFNEWKWRFKDISFYHPEKEIQVELHWRLNDWPAKEPSFKELWSRRRVSNVIQQPCYFLGEGDLFYYLVTHGARHGWFRLRWLMDVQKLIEQSMDWQALYHLFKKYNNVNLAGQAILLASQLNGWEIKDEMKPFLSNRSRKIANSALFFIERMVNIHDTDILEKSYSDYYIKYHSSIRTINQRIWKRLGRLHPRPEDAQILPLPKSFHFLYFLFRPILLLGRKGKRLVLSQDELK